MFFLTKSLAVSIIMFIFAASNQISDQKSLLSEGSVFLGHTTSWEKYNLTATAWGSGNTPKVSANLNLTARSAVSFYCQMSNQISSIEQSETIEIWKDVAGYEGRYQVSNLGRVRSLDRSCINRKGERRSIEGRILRQSPNSSGYMQVSLFGPDFKSKPFRVHRLVAMAFVDGYAEDLVVNHKDENKKNNQWDNLEWCTAEYNNHYNGLLERTTERFARPVIMSTLDGEILNTYPSVSEARRQTGTPISSIIRCCSGQRKSAGGYYWMYAKDKEEKQITQRNFSTIGTCPAVEPLDGEEWRAVSGYEGRYEVSNLGRVRSLDRMCGDRMSRGMLLKQQEMHNGRMAFAVRDLNGAHHCIQTHRAVAMAFVNGYAEGLEVNHKDENPKNNRWDNLEWCTSEYNHNYGTRIERMTASKGRPVVQLTFDDKFVAEYPSANAAARAMGRSSCNKISLCCLRRSETSYGYKWRYKDDIDTSTETDRRYIRELADKVEKVVSGETHSTLLALSRQIAADTFQAMLSEKGSTPDNRQAMHRAADIIASSLRTALNRIIDKNLI